MMTDSAVDGILSRCWVTKAILCHPNSACLSHGQIPRKFARLEYNHDIAQECEFVLTESSIVAEVMGKVDL